MPDVAAPLEDPTYQPEHPPINGAIPDVVEKWGARSQVRWFSRFQGTIAAQRHERWARFYVDSIHHRGLCCDSCLDDFEGGWDYPPDDRCCCRGLRDDD